MKRLRSLGTGKSKAKPEAAARAAEHSGGQWPTVTTVPEEQVSHVHGPPHAQTNSSSADTYVNFSDEEIRAMEESALEYAIQQSQQKSDSSPSDDTQRQSSAQLPAEPHQTQPQVPQPTRQAQAHAPLQANAQPLPETKQKGMSKLKQRLGLKKQGSKTLTATDSSPNPSNLYPMAAGGHHPGNPHVQGQAPTPDPSQRSFPHDPAYPGSGDLQEGHLGMAGQGSGRLLMQGSAGNEEAEEQAMMELAIKESEVQAEYDNVLREAKLLRLDLQHALKNCLEHKVKAQQEHSELSELMGDFGLENAKGKGNAADHAIEQQFAQSEHDLKQASERMTAVNDAIRELQHLEDFIRSTKPPTEEAVMLTEEIVRQLLEKLNFLRLDFPAQSAPKPAPRYESAAIVNRFRQQQARPLGPATPPRPTQVPLQPPSTMPTQEVQEEQQPQTSAATYSNPFEEEEAPGPSSAASSSSGMQSHGLHETAQSLQPGAALEPHQLLAQEEVFTPVSTPRPEAITTPAPAAPPLPPRCLSASSLTSPRELTHVDSHSSTDSATANNLAINQSKEQSRQLLEKASQKLASLLVNANDKNHDASRRSGEASVRRAPQVVHLYQELRKLMGDDFMVKDLNSQDPAATMLWGRRPFQALTAADEQARQRSLADNPAALQAAKSDADKHARLLSKLGVQIRSVKLRSMEDVVSFVQEAEQQLSALKADEGLTVAQLDSWPKHRLDVLREAAGLFQELSYLSAKYQKWMLQQGTCLEEAARIEEFFDTARARVEWLASRQEVTERRFVNHGVPWDRSLFKASRQMCLHLGVIYMSRILFEVANLERSTALKNEACLLHLADAVRIAYKAHQFAGGFNVDSAELFGKVKRLSQYYMRSMDPTWLKDTTKMSSSDGQKWDHVQRR